MAKPMTGSPSGMSHVTRPELACSSLIVTLTGAVKLSVGTQTSVLVDFAVFVHGSEVCVGVFVGVCDGVCGRVCVVVGLVWVCVCVCEASAKGIYSDSFT